MAVTDLKRAVPPSLEPFARLTYHKLFRLYLRIACWMADRFATPRFEVPLPPAILRFRVSELISARAFLRVGEGCAQLIDQQAKEIGTDFARVRRVLDFGCGCGRTIRWFLRAEGATEFHGVDVDAEAIDWCREHLPYGMFLASAPDPPLPYPGDNFDAIYCVSVFTHLDEPMQDSWLRELTRILKPGGVILLTIFGHGAVGILNAKDRHQLRSHGFVSVRSEKHKGLLPEWYQTTFHTRDYLLARLSEAFAEVRYHAVPDGIQDVIVARKRGA